ncbi:hypothetical protein F993_03307 [Acinetobacter proteolyticus]|jgi:hypothetical protein|uniref:Uncharacterized protein n=1 Tax=Acinetobacter proteolyticus TaxID=1776741 RepID=A0ABN0JAB6_9GAMM|nr:glycosyltransferase [Acinetobacter proteolyticus]ENU22032.1 hypothetical protein F993_03307 [Acinetobacter proteolyticus]
MQYFIGQTRFSVYSPDSKAWNISGFTEEDYIKNLYSDERLSIRMEIFIEKSLPLLDLMRKDYFYKHIVSYSSNLPEKWKKHLYSAARKYDFLYLDEVDSNVGNPVNNILQGRSNGSVAYFRLDDDDLLSINYLDYLDSYNNLSFKNMCISFGKGIVAHYENGRFVDFRICNRRFLAIGQAYIGVFVDGKLDIPWGVSHHNVDSQLPVVLDSRNFVFFWTLHSEQDSNHRSGVDNNIDIQLMEYRKIDSSINLEEDFPSLKYDLENFSINEKQFTLVDSFIADRKTLLPISMKNQKLSYEIVYDFEIPVTKKNMPNSLVFSFGFDFDARKIHGLNRSTNNDIGWFRYISFFDGKAKGSFNIVLEEKGMINCLKFFIWNNEISNFKINRVEII